MHRFDPIVLSSIDVAQTEALKRQNTELSPWHLAHGLAANPQAKSFQWLAESKPIIANHLERLAVSNHKLRLEDIRMSASLQEWLTIASSEATTSGRQEVSERELLTHMQRFLPEIKIPTQELEQEPQTELPHFLTDLNAKAQAGDLDPVIGRTREIRSVIEILGRRSKNNPVLVGPAGVGKTAIVEGLADQIVKGRVPDVLKDKTVYSLDMGSLMAGTKYRGEFEERLQNLLKFIKEGSGAAILFIDEIHQLVGAGKTEGAMDAANLLKPALARGELHCIGATTPEEFQKYILTDAALTRRLRQVDVDEPSVEDAIEILMGVREQQEIHHGIKISDEAIYASVLLSNQYITDKHLPDKAIDLVDEAASSLKLSAEAMPVELEQLGADIRAKKIFAKVEPDNEEIQVEITAMQEKFDQAKQLWEQDVHALRKVSSMQNSLNRARFDLERSEREGNYEEASRIKYSVIPELEQELKRFEHTWILDEKGIAAVISRQSGIPVEKILKKKQERLLQLPEFLKSKVYGQEACLGEIAETLITSYAGLSDPSRPMGSFLLKGPTGVGKTETAKAIAEFIFDSPEHMIRIDLSEYAEKHSVAKLIGAPAGYVGYDEGGVLTEAVRRKPHAVILFDEMEKAHSDFADILLQILDDGRLTDNKGRTINFKNTIIFLTSNSQDIERDFKPEVLGRIDGILTYQHLDSSIMERLVAKQLDLLNQRLKNKKISLELGEQAKAQLCEQGFDPKFGARPLQSVFQKLVVRPLAHRVVEGQLEKGRYKMEVAEGRWLINAI